jgi:hypothetical protein
MNKQTTSNAAISRRKILIGCVYIVATAALLASDAANLKQGDDPMTAGSSPGFACSPC